jgi:hypothetical protein
MTMHVRPITHHILSVAVLLCALPACGRNAERELPTEERRGALTGTWINITDGTVADDRPAIAPSAVGGGDNLAGASYVFWPVSGPNIAYRRWNGIAWEATQLLAGPNGSDTFSAPAVVKRNEEQNIVIRSAASPFNIFYNWRSGDGSWSNWQDLGSPPGGLVGSPVLTARPSTSTVQVWVRANDSKLYVKTWTPPSWSNWSKVDDTLMSSGPAALELSANNVHLVFRSSTGAILHRTIINGSPSATTNLGGTFTGAPAISGRDGNRLDVWAVDQATGGIFRKQWTSGGGWATSWDQGPGKPGSVAVSGVTAFDSGSQKRVGVRLTNGEVHYVEFTDDPENAGMAGDKLVLDSSSSSVTIRPWENAFVAVPPNKAGCPAAGAVVAATTTTSVNGARIWRGDLSCFTSAAGSSCAPVFDVICDGSASATCKGRLGQTAGEPYEAGVIDNPGGTSDMHIVRLYNGELLVMDQGVRTDAPGGGSPRGVEYMFKSNDCGQTWRYVTVLDPKCGGSHTCFAGGQYFRSSTRGGFDRPEIYVDPFMNGRIYVALRADGDTVNDALLFYSDDHGNTWQLGATLPRGLWMMTSIKGTGGYLYLFGGRGDDTSKLFINRFHGVNKVLGPNWLAATPAGDHSVDEPEYVLIYGIARIGRYSGADYLRIFYPTELTGGRHGLRGKVIKYWNNGQTDLVSTVSTETISSPSANGSILLGQSIETDRLDLPSADETNLSLLYWYETTQTQSGANMAFGNITAKAKLYRNLVGSSQVFLPFTPGGTVESWPTFTVEWPGDYHIGGFWFDSAANRLRFMPTWNEYRAAIPADHKGEAHLNTISGAR